MMRLYIDAYRQVPGHSEAVLGELFDHQDALYRWRDANRRKIKVADR